MDVDTVSLIVLQQFNLSTQQQQQLQQQQQQHRMSRLLVKIIKANGLADGDFGLYPSSVSSFSDVRFSKRLRDYFKIFLTHRNLYILKIGVFGTKFLRLL